ncbi:hypothetical protein [Cupriavidus necator]|uniref:hypothetical protein n=1 Tax=Cupriavidus necator TaxID=106590 RepID=UPI000F50AA8D|nr:hypothetical protein [Cupriavidus necator]
MKGLTTVLAALVLHRLRQVIVNSAQQGIKRWRLKQGMAHDAVSFIARHNKGDIFPQARACTLPEGTSPASINILAQIPTLSASRKPLMHKDED